MAATIVQSIHDNAKTIEDKVRALPANQGLNEAAMWVKIDAEIVQSVSDGKYIDNQPYKAASKHGK